MGVFSYSDEDASKSFALEDKIDAKTIERRKNALMALQKTISRRKLKQRIGQRMQVMLEGPSKETDLVWEARHEGMAPDIDGKIYVTDFEGVNDAARPSRARHASHTRSHRSKGLRPNRPRRRIFRAAASRSSNPRREAESLPNPRLPLESR